MSAGPKPRAGDASINRERRDRTAAPEGFLYRRSRLSGQPPRPPPRAGCEERNPHRPAVGSRATYRRTSGVLPPCSRISFRDGAPGHRCLANMVHRCKTMSRLPHRLEIGRGTEVGPAPFVVHRLSLLAWSLAAARCASFDIGGRRLRETSRLRQPSGDRPT
jgi:hypothetical protein